MSSSYYAICASHTPALTVSADLGRETAAHLTTRDRFDGHDQCDILIERVSGGIVEMACPGTQLPGPTGCKGRHLDTEWIDIGWLRLLAMTMSSPDPVDPELLRHISTFGCWTRERMASIRGELGLPEPAATDEEAEVRATVAKVTLPELHDAIHKLARLDPAWWRMEVERMNRMYGHTKLLGGNR